MFRRHWSGLPKDAEFPSDLKGLGYFVNDEDEIRSIDNPDNYFKFHLDRNPRVNQRQAFEFNTAKCKIILDRLEKTGLEKIRLPLGASRVDKHVPILVSPDVRTKSRVVVIFGEPTKPLGLLAGRVANGPGGINKGSMVSVVQELQHQVSSESDSSPPGIVIANPGELYWWPEGQKALNITHSAGILLPSLVHAGRCYVEELNDVPGNKTPEAHVEYVFDKVLGSMVDENAKLSLVTVGQSCELLTSFLDNMDNWHRWQGQLDSMLLLGTVYPVDHLMNESFKDFLAKRSRGYITSPDPLDTPLAPPTGHPSEAIPPLGCPCYSSAEPFYIETILISALKPALGFLQHVARTAHYENDEIIVAEKPAREFNDEDWEKLSDGEKPSIGAVNPDAMKTLLRSARRWRKFVETGNPPDSDSSSDEMEQAFDVWG
ncbi:hypothetical protein QQS21_011918, partial [Conoideocrella luteorostrata]